MANARGAYVLTILVGFSVMYLLRTSNELSINVQLALYIGVGYVAIKELWFAHLLRLVNERITKLERANEK